MELALINKHHNSSDSTAALRHFLMPLMKYLNDPTITEVCLNNPKEVVTESKHGWQYYDEPVLTFDYCMSMVKLIATYSTQKTGETSPIFSATLPDGQRCQIVLPPVTLSGTLSITIRRPSSVKITLDDYAIAGAFDEVIEDAGVITDSEIKLLKLKADKKYKEFIEFAVQSHQNIVISGATGSGKTTFGKAVIDLVSREERLISIENVDELRLRDTHKNSVAMFYSAGDQGISNVTPKILMQSSLRQKPDRIFLAELITGDEAFYFMDTVSSGHPGSITTMHSETPAMCIERLTSLIRRSKDGQTMTTTDITKMIKMCIDVIIQFKVIGGRRVVTEIYYDPKAKRSAAAI
jgi:type IV secretion system protein VirB11